MKRRMRLWGAVVFCVVLWLPMEGLATEGAGEELHRACERLAGGLTRTEAVKGKSLTVRPFAGADGQRTLLGLRLQDLLIHALSAPVDKTYRVVERVRLSELDTEKLLYGDGPDDLGEWARALRADRVVLGTYALEAGQVLLTCRLVAPDTGDALLSATARAAITPLLQQWATTPAPVTPMKVAMEALEPAGGQTRGGRARVALFQIQEGKMKGFPAGQPIQLKEGSLVGFSVQPPMDCRLYVLNYDPQSLDDLAVFLYPLPQFRPKIFKRDETSFFPRDVDPRALDYPVYPTYGRMVFKVIGVDARETHLNLTEGVSAEHGYYELDRPGLKTFMSRLRTLPDAAWWEESLEFWITGE